MTSSSDTMMKEYVLTARRMALAHGPRVVPMVQSGKFYEIYDVRPPETSPLLSVAERVLHLRVTRKQKVTISFHRPDEARLVETDAGPALDPEARQPVYVAGFNIEAVDKYRSMLIDRGYTLLPINQNAEREGRTVSALESAVSHANEATAGVVLLADDSVHVARYDARLNAITMGESDVRAPDLHMALDEARKLVAELGGCVELEVHAEEDADALLRATRSVFPQTMARARPLDGRRKFLYDRRWLRRALETHYTWIAALGEDVFGKLGMGEASIHQLATLTLLAGFLHDHDADIGGVLPVPSVSSADGKLRLPHGASSLHLFEAPVDRGSLLDVMLEFVRTPMGMRALRQRLSSPSVDRDAIEARLLDARRGRRLAEETTQLDGLLRGLRDTAHMAQRVSRDRLGAGDVAKLVEAHRRLCKVFEALPDAALLPASAHLDGLRGLMRYCDATFDVDDPADVFVKDGASEALTAARASVRRATERLDTLRERASADAGGSGVSLDARGGLSVIALSASAAKCLRSKGWSVRSPTKSQLILDDDEARAAGQELDDARCGWREAHDAAFAEATRRMRELYFDAHADAVNTAAGAVDMLRGTALFFAQHNYCEPRLLDRSSGEVAFVGLRHPVAEGLVDARGLRYVPNDGRLAADEGWLLYGVNSAGKSSLLKAVAIAVVLAQCGFHVPATSFALAPYESLAMHIGGTDDIYRHQSTFVKELDQLGTVLRASTAHGPRVLFLADELGNSTEDASAVKLVASLLYTLHRRQVTVALATHMFALQTNPYVCGIPTLRNRHLAVTFDERGGIVFERKVLDGLPEERDYGCRIARLLLRGDELMTQTLLSNYHDARSDLAVTGSSRYNREAIDQRCDACGHRPVDRERPLQWHHMVEQREADANGRLPDGTFVHARANLLRVCEECHHRLHDGTLAIERVRETAHGREVVFAANDDASK